jgi:hypothetical protein
MISSFLLRNIIVTSSLIVSFINYLFNLFLFIEDENIITATTNKSPLHQAV